MLAGSPLPCVGAGLPLPAPLFPGACAQFLAPPPLVIAPFFFSGSKAAAAVALPAATPGVLGLPVCLQAVAVTATSSGLTSNALECVLGDL